MSTWFRHKNVTRLGLLNLTWAILVFSLSSLSVASRAPRDLSCPLAGGLVLSDVVSLDVVSFEDGLDGFALNLSRAFGAADIGLLL